VIRTFTATVDVILKRRRVLAEIVEDSDQRAEAARAEFFGPRRCQSRHRPQMLCQRLPRNPIPAFNGMGEEHESNKPGLLTWLDRLATKLDAVT
jgi:hypothetical protein